MPQESKRQADATIPEIIFSPEMRAAGVRLMQAWDDQDDPDNDVGGSYGIFLERLFREVLARHSPAVSVRTQAVD